MIDTNYRSAIYFETDMSESDTKSAIERYFDSLNIEKEKGKGFIMRKKSMGYMLFKRAKVDYINDNIDCYFVVNGRKIKPVTLPAFTLRLAKTAFSFRLKVISRNGAYKRICSLPATELFSAVQHFQ